MKKKVVVALGHRALGTTLPEQMVAVHKSAKAIADLIEDGYDPYCNERIWKSASGLYICSDVCLLCHESGLYRI